MIQEFEGKRPKIAKTAFIHELACIIGDVAIGDGSSVWPGAVIRGDIRKITIGKNSHIEDNAVLHSGSDLTIGDSVLIGHGAIVHGRNIGNWTLIGNNATILDNTEIGDYCIIAAGSVVVPNTILPQKSLASGMPAQIKGHITEKQLAKLEAGPVFYTNLAQKYMKQPPR